MWKQYFQELYNNNQIDDNLPNNFSVEEKQKEIGKNSFETIKLILNCPFSKTEMLSCKEKLKNSKSSGADMIKNEVLNICLDNKNFLDALHINEMLINEIFDKDKYPVQLKTELIKLIHIKEEIHFE